MRRRAVVASLALICLIGPVSAAQAKVLAVGEKVDSHPLTFAASETLFEPSHLAFDVVAHPSDPVKVEWFLLCTGSQGPISGDEYVLRRPDHRRLKMPKRPRGVCLFDSRANYVDRQASGRITLRLRGRTRHMPGLPGSAKSR